MKIKKVIETCIYSSDLGSMKKFYTGILGLSVVQEERDKLIFLRAGNSMLLIFNPARTLSDNGGLPCHGALTPPSSIHFAMEIEKQEYHASKQILVGNNIDIEKEVSWNNDVKSIYFRDPAGNLVELITPGGWPVES
ncbi:MAG: VOC family protein [Thermoproteota archaeon]|nr:VOC family protein [Thermoproteota archaeon]